MGVGYKYDALSFSNIIQMYEKCKKQFQEAEKAAQVANENCNSMCAEKNLAQAQLNVITVNALITK